MSLTTPYQWDDSASATYTDHIPYGANEIDSTVKRVLVLGCATAKGFIALAEVKPDVEFVLVDMNDKYIKKVRENAPQNVTAFALSFKEYEEKTRRKFADKFDLIYCWGVLSAVSPEVQQDIFRIFNTLSGSCCRVILSYTNALYAHAWTTLREASIALCKTYDTKLSAEQLLPMLRNLYADEGVMFSLALDDLSKRPELFRHTVFQPDWKPLWSFEVTSQMIRSGFRQVTNREEFSHGDDLFKQKKLGHELEGYRVELWR